MPSTHAKELKASALQISESQRRSFFSKIAAPNEGGCMEWLAAKSSKGYGVFGFGGRMYRAPRLVYALLVGDIPAGMLVCHSCDNPTCCNPGHLFLGTSKDNQVDKVLKNRHAPQAGHLNNGARLDELDVQRIRLMRQDGIEEHVIAKAFNVHQSTISKIVTKCTWRHI